MKTKQSIWKCVANLGDATPWDYGGQFVMVDQTGVYRPELWIWEEPTDDGPQVWTEYRLCLEHHTYINGILSDNKFHPDYAVWYADKLGSVAETTGTTEEDLIEQLCSVDPVDRAVAYRVLVGYFGPDEFDQYPLEFQNRGQVMLRMRNWLKQINRG